MDFFFFFSPLPANVFLVVRIICVVQERVITAKRAAKWTNRPTFFWHFQHPVSGLRSQYFGPHGGILSSHAQAAPLSQTPHVVPPPYWTRVTFVHGKM